MKKIHYQIEPNYESYYHSHNVVSFCGRKFDKTIDKNLSTKIDEITCKKCLKIINEVN